MKATAPSLGAAVVADKSRFTVFSELVKARLTFLVLLTTLVGFYVGFHGALDYLLLFHTLLGTGLMASGAAALNQLLERKYDALMRRTEDRPLPSGRLRPDTVLIFGGLCSAAGLVHLAIAVNLLTSLLGGITLGSYLFIYTPLKRVTPLNTAIGAVPGALPPLMGWTAAGGEINVEGWSLFAILFFWQLPHFLAIAWIYREDYAKAGFAMLPVFDPDGQHTSRQAVSHTLGLLPISLCPFLFGLEGTVYLTGALVLSLGFVWQAIRFSRDLTVQRARQLFYASIIYLPLLLGLMVFDKIK
ncbi:MAG: protoheme IX farnesyltransferase [Verrucomicrobia bacterium]|nr:MAG: protoheme IX farnesyltransferase [Verrucomicrobiota bacterium]